MIDPAFKEFLEKAEAQLPALMEKGIKKIYRHEFSDFDCSTLIKMTNKELAAWQSQFPIDSPQYIIAIQEWNRRSLMEQTKWMKRSVYIGFIGVLIGAILTAVIAWLLPPYHGNNQIQKQTINQTSKQSNGNNKTNIAPPGRQKP